jgi:protease secretion system outer membrane protein
MTLATICLCCAVRRGVRAVADVVPRVVVGIAALLLQAAPSSAMGLMQAYDAALENDPLYRSAVSDNEAGQQFKVIGRSNLLPTVQYNYGNGKNKADITAPDVRGQPVTTNPDYTSITKSLSVRQTLFNPEAVARYRQGIAQTHYSDAQFAGRSQDLMIRLAMAYADVKFAEDQLALYGAQRAALAEQRRVNDSMFASGEGTRTDMLETQARLDMADAQVIDATDNLVLTRSTLAAIIGRDVTQLDGLHDDFTLQPLSQTGMGTALPGIDEWKAIANLHNAELAAGRYAEEIAEQDISKSRAGHAPRLDLNASISRSRSDTLATYRQDASVRSIGIALVVPLYSGGYVSASATQAVANRDKARSDRDAIANKVAIELQKQISPAQNSAVRLAALQKAVDSSTLLVQATRASVNGGARINLDVLNAQQQLVAARRDLSQARYNCLIAFLKLRMAAGILDIDDLRTVARYFSNAH